jgi:hypothetical protein
VEVGQTRVTSAAAVGKEELAGFLAGPLGVMLVAVAHGGAIPVELGFPGAGARAEAVLVQDQELALGAGAPGVSRVALAVPRPEDALATEAGLRFAAQAPPFPGT